MFRTVLAIAFTAFAILGFLVGYLSNSGPLDYIFFVIAGIPWTQFLSWLFASGGGSPAIPAIGVLINLILVWWWALWPARKK